LDRYIGVGDLEESETSGEKQKRESKLLRERPRDGAALTCRDLSE
jgi:hypothetical protein